MLVNIVQRRGFGDVLQRIDRAIFKDAKIRHLAVYIVGNHLQTVEYQRLAHHVKVRAERIEHTDTTFLRKSREP